MRRIVEFIDWRSLTFAGSCVSYKASLVRWSSLFSPPMADEHQSKPENASLNGRGGGQIVVSLCGMNEGGLILRSRHRFEVAAEVQLRIRWDVLPDCLRQSLQSDPSGWVNIRGFVIDCRVARQSGGKMIFIVSLMLDLVLSEKDQRARKTDYRRVERSGIHGLN